MYIIRQPYKNEGDDRFYVQHVSYIDYGRFATEEAAKELKDFLEDQEKSYRDIEC